MGFIRKLKANDLALNSLCADFVEWMNFDVRQSTCYVVVVEWYRDSHRDRIRYGKSERFASTIMARTV